MRLEEIGKLYDKKIFGPTESGIRKVYKLCEEFFEEIPDEVINKEIENGVYLFVFSASSQQAIGFSSEFYESYPVNCRKLWTIEGMDKVNEIWINIASKTFTVIYEELDYEDSNYRTMKMLLEKSIESLVDIMPGAIKANINCDYDKVEFSWSVF